MQETQTFVVPKGKWRLLEAALKESGFLQIGPKSDYEYARFKAANANLIIYSSGKVVVQGKGLGAVEGIMKDVGVYSGNTQSNDNENFSGIPRIGADEVGKGDYFGPLITAAAYITKEDEKFLSEMGVADSKGKEDEEISRICDDICNKITHTVTIVHPVDYNHIYEEVKNASILLAKAHSNSIDQLVEDVESREGDLELIVVDQFSSSKKRILDELTDRTLKYKVEQFHKGESDLAVATASIIARAYFLKEWDKMNEEFGFIFPKGATNVVKAGKEFVGRFGESRLHEVAKVTFKTTQKVLE